MPSPPPRIVPDSGTAARFFRAQLRVGPESGRPGRRYLNVVSISQEIQAAIAWAGAAVFAFPQAGRYASLDLLLRKAQAHRLEGIDHIAPVNLESEVLKGVPVRNCTREIRVEGVAESRRSDVPCDWVDGRRDCSRRMHSVGLTVVNLRQTNET